MNPYTVITYPNDVLSTKTEDVKIFDERLRALAFDMKDIMLQNNGIGLAANQIGVSERVAIVETDTMINPTIMFKGKAVHCMEEGCLSLPGKRYLVLRPVSITVKYQGVDGRSRIETAHGLRARIIQHEIDHLNGTCICNKGVEI